MTRSVSEFRGATDDEGGLFVCVDCIPRLEPGEGERRETCIEDMRAEFDAIASGDDMLPEGALWSGVFGDYLRDIGAATGGCIFCGRLPARVKPGQLPTVTQ